jgi:hypothetical protein
MGWGKIVLLNLDPKDSAISDAAKDYIKYYKLLTGRCHSTQGAHEEYRKLGSPDSKKWLGKLTEVDKVMVVSHGATDATISLDDEWKNGRQLARLFWQWGIRKAGLITFKCCNLGNTKFLEDFQKGCGTKIKVGYIKGYLSKSATEWRLNLMKLTRKPYEAVKGAKGREGRTTESRQEDRYRCISGTDGSEVAGRAYRDAMDQGQIE